MASGLFSRSMPIYSPDSSLPIDLFTRLSRHEALNFGYNGECFSLTADHFAFPGARTVVIKSLPEQCFMDMPPDCFSGMSRRQVRAIVHWPIVRPEQVSALSPHAIMGLNFDLLGMAPQDPSMLDPLHPCQGVTMEQEDAINPLYRKWMKYNAQCHGGAPLITDYYSDTIFYALLLLMFIWLFVTVLL